MGPGSVKPVSGKITDAVVNETNEWCTRGLLPIYAAIFIDAIGIKVRDGHVSNRAFYAAIGVDLEGHRDVGGIWAGWHGRGESAKYWMGVLTEIKNRGVSDVFFIVAAGLKGLPDSAHAAFPAATTQIRIIHVTHRRLRMPPRTISAGLEPIYGGHQPMAHGLDVEEFETG